MASGAVVCTEDTANNHQASGSGSLYSQQHGREKQGYKMSSFDINDGSGSEDVLLLSIPLLEDRDDDRSKRQGRGSTNFDYLYSRITTRFSQFRRRGWRVCGRGVLLPWVIKHRLILSLLILISSASFIFRQYYHEPYLKAVEWRRDCASQTTFQPAQYLSAEPAGILVGVMSVATEKAAKRRMEIRESWASHWASRGRWDEGQVWSPEELASRNASGSGSQNMMYSTSRVVVRFVLGRPEPAWRESIREEMNQYNDIIILPIQENANEGKTFAFLDWSFKHALVPPPPILQDQTLISSTDEPEGGLKTRFFPGYDDIDHDHGRRHGWARLNAFEARKPAEHDPKDVDGTPFVSKLDWVRPDYVVKVHDDSFLMLAELEARLRTLPRTGVYWGHRSNSRGVDYHSGEAYALSWDVVGHVSTYARRHQPDHGNHGAPLSVQGSDSYDPHHRKDRHDGSQRGSRKRPPYGRGRNQRYRNLALTISGQEDLVTAGWMKEHGESWGVTWYDEQCWIYDHPSAGTIHSRGFLFPLEVFKILREWIPFISREDDADASGKDDSEKGRERTKVEADSARPEIRRRYDAAYSTVVRALYRHSHPARTLLPSSTIYSLASSHINTEEWPLKRGMEMDGLIEGSELSMVVAGVDSDAEIARRWKKDFELGWKGLYMLQNPVEITLPLGGTVVVHYVQNSAHWRECVEVLLLGWDRERKLKERASQAKGI